MAASRRIAALAAVALALVAVLAAAGASAVAAAAYTLPPANARFDYQIGGAYRPAADVRIVDRDRLAAPVGGRYNVCYVNAFQTQPADARWWTRRHPELLLRRPNGRFLIDPDWPDEYILDTGTVAKRRALAAIVGDWIDRCARDGFQAVEPDNLDTWTRSKRQLTRADNAAFARLLAQRAHRAGLAIAQKNAVELSPRRSAIGFDFAIAEECEVWSECDGYTAAYGDQVYEIEYSDSVEDANGRRVRPISFFRAACQARGARISIVYRDRMVLPRGRPGHVDRAC